MYTPDTLPANVEVDLVLAPDVIEHVPNVGDFLEGLKKYNADIVITTPNAFRWQNRVSFRGEHNNTDHRYWFSPYTLAKTLVESGYEPTNFWYTQPISPRIPLKSAIGYFVPMCRDGLAIRAKAMPIVPSQ